MRIVRYTGVTDTGRKRRRNEDAYVVRPPVFAVADGMGGSRAGEVASALAAAAVKADDAAGDGEARVVQLVQEANRRIYARSTEDANVSGMGTTMTLAIVEDDGVAFGHVGDSRAYVARGGSIEQLTDDHSLVAELVRGGKLSPEEADNHPQRSVITRVLGADPEVDVDVFTVAPEPGDIFLICSDGLTSMVSDEAILGVLREHAANLERAAKELVRLANRAGGEDNITIIAFEVDAEGGADGDAPTETHAAIDDADTLDETDAVPTVAAAPPSSTTAPPARRRKSVLGWSVALLVLALLVAAAVAWLLLR